MMKKLTMAVAVMFATSAYAGEWHAVQNNICTDCHTMHFSQTHNWDGSTPVSATPQPGGNWLSASGPNHYLLKAPVNDICKSCHDGQSFAPDVVGLNTNAAPTQGRSAGALNEAALGAPYEDWKGHTLGSTATPPGYNPAAVWATFTYDPTNGLECINCHLQHGSAVPFRNLGPRNLAGGYVDYVISTTNDPTKDVWVNIASQTGAIGNRTAADFNPYYDSASIQYNRNDATVGTTKTSNQIDTMCAVCHGNFHGGGLDTAIGGVANGTNFEEFLRHPTAQTNIGALGGGHSNLTRFVGNTTKVKVYTNDRTAYTLTSPGCVSCHKAHGNQNPFGLIFLNGAAASVDEQGGYRAGQTPSVQQGYRNLCGQCHGQGASTTAN